MKPTINQIKYIAYSRKSTEGEDRQILSLDDQKREVEDMERRDSLKVVERYLGKGRGESQTAHKRGRPTFNHIMRQIEAGRANGLLVWHPNRLARNAYDGGLIITLMDEGQLFEIRTPHRTYHNTPDDKFFLQLEFGMAKKSSDDNSVAVKRGLKTKLQMGWYPSRAPLGYLNTITKEKGDNQIVKDPERFDLVRRMWDLMLTGNYTPPQILKMANEEWKLKTRPTKKYTGLKPLARSAIYNIFTNHFYYGWFEYGKNGNKELYKGNHEPMITEDEFDRVQKLLGRDGRPRAKEHRFAFTGLMKCGNCGAMITAEEKIKRQKNGNVHHYIYYHCTKRKDENCPEKMIELKDLNFAIDTLVKNLSISEKFKSWAIKYLHEIRQNEAVSNQTALENKQKLLARVTDQLHSLLLKYTSPENANEELMTAQEMQMVKNSLLKEKSSLEKDLKEQGKTIEEWVALSEQTFDFARYAQMWFAKGDMATRRAIFAALGSHLVIESQKLNVELHPYFKVIFENVSAVEKELLQVRTSENATDKRQIAQVWAKCPTLRRVVDDVRTCFQNTVEYFYIPKLSEQTALTS